MNKLIAAALAAACLFTFASADNFKVSKLPKNYYKYDQEFKAAAKEQGVPLVLLKSIALTENMSMRKNTRGYNTNGTIDYGLMQINSIHLDYYGLTEDEILDPKTNIVTAAKILKQIIEKHGYSWDSIGRYHSATQKYKEIWTKRVKKSMIAILKMDKSLGPQKMVQDGVTVALNTVKRAKAVMVEIKELRSN